MTLDELVGDPEFRDLVAEAVLLLEERCARGVASPAETLTVVALAEQPDEGDAPRCVRGSRRGNSVRRCGWSSRRRSRCTSAWSRRWRTKRARATAGVGETVHWTLGW